LRFERFTGNRQGCFESWLLTPEQGTARIPKTLPGLENFWLVQGHGTYQNCTPNL